MQHEPKLNVYTVRLIHLGQTENTNRTLFKKLTRHMREVDDDPDQSDESLFLDFFKYVIGELDKPEMFRDENSKRSMTAYQSNISDSNVEQNVTPKQEKSIIYGVVEGGKFGRKRNKTNIADKTVKDEVQLNDAITDQFCFLIYLPPSSNRGILMVQSYSDETIDPVMRGFWEKALTVPDFFRKPKIERFTPKKIIDDFKQRMEVSELSFSTYVVGDSLFDNVVDLIDRRFRVTITIESKDGDLSIDEVKEGKHSIFRKAFGAKKLIDFEKKKGKAVDVTNGKPSSFELDSDFEVLPTIYLAKYVPLTNSPADLKLINDFCIELLEKQIIPEVFPENAIQER